jgi:hypothetical protein
MPRYEAISFPDVEALVIEYLTEEFALISEPATIHTRIPSNRDETKRFVVVPRVGGTRKDLVVDRVTIGFEAWAATPAQAYDLANKTRALIFALKGHRVNGVQFYEIQEFAGPANLPDTLSKQPRYVFTTSIFVRGTALG